MKKKYQVFVSSTYSDLKEERRAVMQCLLEMDCIPVGMEQFPASDMKQMEYIQMMIDDCDYYILILAGRYGSVDTDDIGFTEKEYDYAVANKIPVMSFVVDPGVPLTSEKCEDTENGKNKLAAFRNKVCSGKLVRFYSDIGSLTTGVAVSLNRCIQNYPAVGWVRGTNTDTTHEFEEKIEAYLKEHTITEEDIDKLFSEENGGSYHNDSLTGYFTFDYSNNNGEFTIGKGKNKFVTKWSKASKTSIHAYKGGAGIGCIAKVKGPIDFEDISPFKYDYSSRVRTPEIGDVIVWKNDYGKYAATRIIDIKDDTRGDDNDELTCEYIVF